MNELNLRLQDENISITDVFSYVQVFRARLQLQDQNVYHVPRYAKFHEDNKAEYPSFAKDVIESLQKQFNEQFSHIDRIADEIKMFQNTFVMLTQSQLGTSWKSLICRAISG